MLKQAKVVQEGLFLCHEDGGIKSKDSIQEENCQFRWMYLCLARFV